MTEKTQKRNRSPLYYLSVVGFTVFLFSVFFLGKSFAYNQTTHDTIVFQQTNNIATGDWYYLGQFPSQTFTTYQAWIGANGTWSFPDTQPTLGIYECTSIATSTCAWETNGLGNVNPTSYTSGAIATGTINWTPDPTKYYYAKIPSGINLGGVGASLRIWGNSSGEPFLQLFATTSLTDQITLNTIASPRGNPIPISGIYVNATDYTQIQINWSRLTPNGQTLIPLVYSIPLANGTFNYNFSINAPSQGSYSIQTCLTGGSSSSTCSATQTITIFSATSSDIMTPLPTDNASTSFMGWFWNAGNTILDKVPFGFVKQIYDYVDTKMPLATTSWSVQVPTLTGTTTSLTLDPNILINTEAQGLLRTLSGGVIVFLYIWSLWSRGKKLFT